MLEIGRFLQVEFIGKLKSPKKIEGTTDNDVSKIKSAKSRETPSGVLGGLYTEKIESVGTSLQSRSDIPHRLHDPIGLMLIGVLPPPKYSGR